MSNSKQQESSEDRISGLPDSVLIHILSFLPTRDAVKTVLIRRFRHLWPNLHTLSFDHCAFHDCEEFIASDCTEYDETFLNLIRHVLILHDSASLYKFHLSIYFSLPHSLHAETIDSLSADESDWLIKEKRMANEFDTWVRFTVRKNVKVLHLDLSGCFGAELEANYALPNVVLSSGHLTELKLVSCNIKPREQIRLKSLRMLSLQKILLTDKIMDEILSGCPLLEDLSIVDCYGLRKLNFTNLSNKKLALYLGDEETRLKVSCPNLISLKINGWIERLDLMNESPSVDASLYFGCNFKCGRKGYGEIKMLLQKLHNSKTLTLYINSGSYYVVENQGTWFLSYDFDGENYWKSLEASFYCLTHHFKTVTIFSNITEPYVIELAGFLLKNSMVLEKMVISTSKHLPPGVPPTFITTQRQLEFCKKLLSIPRASSLAVIQFS